MLWVQLIPCHHIDSKLDINVYCTPESSQENVFATHRLVRCSCNRQQRDAFANSLVYQVK